MGTADDPQRAPRRSGGIGLRGIYCAIQIGVFGKDIDVVVRLRRRYAATRVSCAWAASSSRSYLCREARAPAAASALVPGLGATGRWAAGSFLAFHDYRRTIPAGPSQSSRALIYSSSFAS